MTLTTADFEIVPAPRPQPYGDADPFRTDTLEDLPLVTTERRLLRLAAVAADVGARFARESIDGDAVAWMLTPRKMFDGARALDACQGYVGFNRALHLHGLSLGLDGDPKALDALIPGNDDRECDASIGRSSNSSRKSECGKIAGDVRLYTCTVDGELGSSGHHVQAFCAVVAPNEAVVRHRLRVRYGPTLADRAELNESFDPQNVLAQVLLSKPLLRMLQLVAENPDGELAAGLDLLVEQRFDA